MRNIYNFILLAIIVAIPLSVILSKWGYYTKPYYDEIAFKSYEQAFNTSQYRQEVSPGIIPDETLFSYVSGAYLRGMDPITANSEHTPLGKYMIALSIYFFKNDRLPVIVFALLSGLSIWLLSKTVLGLFALIPLLLVVLDRLFINQLITAPLLDIIQLPFIYLSLLFFLKKQYFWTSIFIGLVISTKTVVPGILLVATFTLFFLLQKKYNSLLQFYKWLPVSSGILLLGYTRTFMNGYTLWDFLKFQKWIFDYQGSKLIYPFSSLRLLLFNQWQTWWDGNKIVSANDWSILWPISTIAVVWIAMQKKKNNEVMLLVLWVLIYQIFLCLGVVSSRFFIPLLPAQYILTIEVLKRYAHRNKHNPA